MEFMGDALPLFQTLQMIPEGYYYETRQKPDPPSKSKKEPVADIVVKVTLALTITISIGITLSHEFSEDVDTTPPTVPTTIPTVPTTIPTVPTTPPTDPTTPPTAPTAPPTAPTTPPTAPTTLPTVPTTPLTALPYTRISIPRYCNGHYAGSANFRSSPTLMPSAIKGVVPVGNYVLLTGEVLPGDGVHWHQAINESNLLRSNEPAAQNQLGAGQIGWIADCFVH
ncbi:MAG: hypothetical protein AAF827_18160 [Cyanobacteria bacterium P01_D01_bin.6]